MDYSQFVELTESWKLFLVDVEVGAKAHEYAWVQHGVHTNTWYTTYIVGFPARMVEDGTEYVERFTLSEVDGNAGSYYYDFVNQVLYVHDLNSDDPGSMTGSAYDYNVLTFQWRNFCNSQYEDANQVVFAREQEALADGSFENWITPTNLTSWSETAAGGSTVNRETGLDNVYHGGYSLRLDIDAGNNTAKVEENVILEPRGRNRIRIRYKMSLPGKTAKIYISDIAGNVWLDSSGDWQVAASIVLPNSLTWAEFDLEFYAHKDYTNYTIEIQQDVANSSSIYFDYARLTRYREDNQYLPYFQSSDLPSITQAVADFHVGAMKMQFGRLRFLNDGYWYSTFLTHLWHNKDIIVRYGAKGSTWDELETIFRGKTQKPAASDQFAQLVVTDDRVLTYQEIPATKYWTSTYANLEAGADGIPIPIIYGQFSNIVPTCIDTATYKYKIANHLLEAIDDVYKDGVALVGGGTDYTVDLANGEFTLVEDPGDSFITCDVKGKQCSLIDGSYSENVADIVYDVLVNHAHISEDLLDKESILDLRSARTQKHQLYLDVSTSIFEIIRQLQASALFHIIPLPTRKLGAFRYATGTDAGTRRFVDEDYAGFQLSFDTSGVYKQIKLRYCRNPGDNSYSTSIRTENAVEWEHGETDTLTITTTLRLQAEAENLGDYYKALLQDPLKKIRTTIPTVGFQYRPAEKGIFNKTKMTDDGALSVLSEEAYRVMELKKNIKTGKVDIVALEDMQSAGAPFCEICVTCQVCNTTESGVCTTCFSCEKCDSGQCEDCQICNFCQKCDAGECAACESCDTCQKCNTGECTECESCNVCEKCNTGECTECQTCDSCEKCDSCQNSQCDSCQDCDSCQKCDTCQNSQCTTCEDCVSCEKCDSGQCALCQSCDDCQKCDTCQNSQCTACEACDSCEKCDTCQNSECDSCQTCDTCEKCDSGECTTCMDCDSCQKCDTCQNTQCSGCQICVGCEKCDTCENSQCTICEACNTCEKCDSGECTICQDCDGCQKCNTGECTICQDCDTCQKCDAGECASCETCFACEKCDTCQNSQCTACEACDSCQKCNTCQNTQCSGCEICVGCEKCDTCQNSQCTICEACNTCEKCDSGQCTTCMSCNTCQKCDSGECADCQLCDACQKCDAGECTACQICVGCQKCDAGECTACQICVGCQKCDAGECTICMKCDTCEKCDSGECTICMSCVSCQACVACYLCVGCENCDECMECFNCENEPM